MKPSWCVIAWVLCGCEADPLGSIASAEVGGSDCERLNCPGNSDLMGVLLPFELDRTGSQLSPRRVRITGLEYLGVGIGLHDFGISGTWPYVNVGPQTVTGPGLVGLTMTLLHEPEDLPPKSYTLSIDGFTRVPYYVDEHGAGFIGYHIVYTEPGQTAPPHELCPYQEYEPDHGTAATWAVFWAGDRYDPETGLIYQSDEQVGPWFNLSCAGEATIKMLRTKTGGAVDPSSPVEQRQATLNMFTAAYCGPGGPRTTTDGVPFTKLGQPIAWSDLSGPSELGEGASIEAVWDESGAVCLSTPRKADVTADQIVCDNKQPKTIKPCKANHIADWPSYGWLLSGTPPP